MHRLTAPAFAVSLALVAGGTWFFARPKADSPPPSKPTGAGQVQVEAKEDPALRHELTLLQRQVATLSKRSSAEDAAADPSSSADKAEPGQAGAPAPPATDEERREAAKQQHDRWKHGMESLVKKEPSDPRWTAEMQQEVTTAFANDAGTAIRSVECHATLCQVELTHQDRQALEVLKEDMSNTLHYPMTLLHEPDGDSFKSVLFIAHEGEPLPDWRGEADVEEKQL